MSWADHNLMGRTVLVTGGASGIEKAIATLFAGEGANVMAADRDADGLAVVAEQENVTAIECDLNSAEGCEQAVATAVEQTGAIDVLVNNVGAAPVRDSFLNVSDADWTGLLSINLFSMIRCCRAAIP